MDFNDLVRAENIERAIKGGTSTSLIDILPRLTKKKLYDIAVNYNIPMRSKMNKAELVEIIPDYIGNTMILEEILLIAKEDEMELFHRVLRHGYIESDMIYFGRYGHFMEMGLMFPFWDGDRFYLVIPDEVRGLYKEIDINKFTKDYNRIQYV